MPSDIYDIQYKDIANDLILDIESSINDASSVIRQRIESGEPRSTLTTEDVIGQQYYMYDTWSGEYWYELRYDYTDYFNKMDTLLKGNLQAPEVYIDIQEKDYTDLLNAVKDGQDFFGQLITDNQVNTANMLYSLLSNLTSSVDEVANTMTEKMDTFYIEYLDDIVSKISNIGEVLRDSLGGIGEEIALQQKENFSGLIDGLKIMTDSLSGILDPLQDVFMFILQEFIAFIKTLFQVDQDSIIDYIEIIYKAIMDFIKDIA